MSEFRRTAVPALISLFILTAVSPSGAAVELVEIVQVGRDSPLLVLGGCDVDGLGRDAPDRYLDAGESVTLDVSFQSTVPLVDAVVTLIAVEVDADSPADCLPGSGSCTDPDRANNLISPDLIIAGSPLDIPAIAAGVPQTASFDVVVDSGLSGTPKIEFVIGVSSSTTAEELLVVRQVLNADESSTFYSTDWPFGGTEIRDFNNNELIEDPIVDPGNPLDGLFETIVWSDLTAGGTVNLGLQSPWNFDVTDGGFTSGISGTTDFFQIADVIAQWGEDLNFNNVNDGFCTLNPARRCLRDAGPFVCPDDPILASCSAGTCTDAMTPGTAYDGVVFSNDGTCFSSEDRDPGTGSPNSVLDRNWSTRGGCGWQTRAPGSCSLDINVGCYNDQQCADVAAGICSGPPQPTGGVWHTGRIGSTTNTACLVVGNNPGDCQAYETIGGFGGSLQWFELLLTPVVQKVNPQLDADGDPVYTAEILNWAWNASVDLADANATFTWELDNDFDRIAPVNLIGDDAVLGSLTGPFGAVHPIAPPPPDGYPLFAELDPFFSVNGVVGGNRVGKNACFFEGGTVGPSRWSSSVWRGRRTTTCRTASARPTPAPPAAVSARTRSGSSIRPAVTFWPIAPRPA